ncbi:uroporphyrinogen-III C-methyltransferase [Sphingobacterium alkalisoli]|uniref:uroporphyrinogen-III C-methyltransferase n=1 Tax=Sphingobacterium alkalisoli TaxID=1874115 RepID=A0A4U0GZE7_9SPHI|nr:uroporphyrinogen-III C-methyltransferase [Sphingobacterium alkalisoli]GGH20845.1 uroporphyrin-III C-methyltransferase [Sphingobacterium alkalisoli]
MVVVSRNLRSKLYLIGSGPGDPDLLTIKAYKILEKADVLLFDHLVNPEILTIVPENCVKVYVGKEPYANFTPQESIHSLIEQYCRTYKCVVRLKGGDPYIFGRGFEELLFAEELGIEVEYIPGISSMQGAGFHNIPLTHRDVSDGIWALTGTKKDGRLSSDLQLAIQSNSTVVIYMGMKKLDEIARTYVMCGKGDTPAAIIQCATLPGQREVVCEVADLLNASRDSGLSHPAIIVIGEVVRLYASNRNSFILNDQLAKMKRN